MRRQFSSGSESIRSLKYNFMIIKVYHCVKIEIYISLVARLRSIVVSLYKIKVITLNETIVVAIYCQVCCICVS